MGERNRPFKIKQVLEDYKKKSEELNYIVSKITNFLLIDRIYLCVPLLKGNSKPEIILVIPLCHKQDLKEAIESSKWILAQFTQYSIRVYHATEVREAIKNGGMAFLYVTDPDNLLYINPKSNYQVPKILLEPSKILQRGNSQVEYELEKVDSFFQGVQFYLSLGKLKNATFLLHQVFELSYRTCELLIWGKEKITHCLRSHQKLLTNYIDDFNNVFDINMESEMRLIDLIDDAYSAVRYENNFNISRTDFDQLLEKSYMIRTICRRTVDSVLSSYQLYYHWKRISEFGG